MIVEHLHITPAIHLAKHLVVINEHFVVLLPFSRFEFVVKALVCRVTKPQGFIIAQDVGAERLGFYQVIARVRKDFAAVLGDDVRKALVSNFGKGRYRLELERAAVTIDRALEELVPTDIEARDFEILRTHYETRRTKVDSVMTKQFSASHFIGAAQPASISECTNVPRQSTFKDQLSEQNLRLEIRDSRNQAMLNSIEQRATEKFGLEVDVEAASLDLTGIVRAVVSNPGLLFVSHLNFRLCSSDEAKKHITKLLHQPETPAAGASTSI